MHHKIPEKEDFQLVCVLVFYMVYLKHLGSSKAYNIPNQKYEQNSVCSISHLVQIFKF